MRDPLTLDLRLRAAATQFEAFQLLRLIECAHAKQARLGAAMRPSQEPVRIGQDAELRFSGAQVSSYEPGDAIQAPRLALDFGLLGPDGPMPLHLTESVRARSRHLGDATLERFLDLFHHRMASLRYRAWAASQPVIAADRCGEDGFARYLGSVCGLAADRACGQGVLTAEEKLGAAALVGDRRRPAVGLAALLRRTFGVKVAVESFAGQWLAVPEDELAPLGAGGRPSLRRGYLLGRRVWDRQSKFVVVLGPLDASQCDRLQPGRREWARLEAWVRWYVGATLDFDIALRLTHDAAPAMRLGRGTRLARNTWLGSTKTAGVEPVLRFRRLAASQR
jgi:type VI secretion system protein ImpH